MTSLRSLRNCRPAYRKLNVLDLRMDVLEVYETVDLLISSSHPTLPVSVVLEVYETVDLLIRY